MANPLTRLIEAKTNEWLFRMRESEPGEVYLNQRRVFIVMTRPGLAFALLVLVLLIGSINYNLGLGFALTFSVACCAIIDMLFTFRNLAHLHLVAGHAAPVFAGEEARFEVHVLNRSRVNRYAIWIDFLSAGEPRHVVDVDAGGRAHAVLGTPSSARGWLAAPRIRLITRFPLGLFRAWSYWSPDARVLVYPFPEAEAPPLPMRGVASADGHGSAGHDDFAGIRTYQPGDPMRHMAWRQIARLDPSLGGQLVTKHFEGGALEELVLDFAALPSNMDLELRLSRMARWVLDAEASARPYAFLLGAVEFGAGLGEAHQAACLRALALYGIRSTPP